MSVQLMKAAAVLALGAAVIALGACDTATKAPMDPGVCYSVTPAEDGKSAPAFNVVARDQPQLEYCAARLEEMRVRFLRMGGTNRDIIGAYQGQFLFLDPAGVKVGKTLTGSRFFFLARTGDGRLAVPGVIQRDVDGRPVAVIEPDPAKVGSN